eukprot:GHVN01093742.1.p1 GENE.GHVN01093742.1~~GHVN01093742.1.p1  ORF type:complete len:1084 (-),score=334.28 GHVN01093742.1:893-4144(-)
MAALLSTTKPQHHLPDSSHLYRTITSLSDNTSEVARPRSTRSPAQGLSYALSSLPTRSLGVPRGAIATPSSLSVSAAGAGQSHQSDTQLTSTSFDYTPYLPHIPLSPRHQRQMHLIFIKAVSQAIKPSGEPSQSPVTSSHLTSPIPTSLVTITSLSDAIYAFASAMGLSAPLSALTCIPMMRKVSLTSFTSAASLSQASGLTSATSLTTTTTSGVRPSSGVVLRGVGEKRQGPGQDLIERSRSVSEAGDGRLLSSNTVDEDTQTRAYMGVGGAVSGLTGVSAVTDASGVTHLSVAVAVSGEAGGERTPKAKRRRVRSVTSLPSSSSAQSQQTSSSTVQTHKHRKAKARPSPKAGLKSPTGRGDEVQRSPPASIGKANSLKRSCTSPRAPQRSPISTLNQPHSPSRPQPAMDLAQAAAAKRAMLNARRREREAKKREKLKADALAVQGAGGEEGQDGASGVCEIELPSAGQSETPDLTQLDLTQQPQPKRRGRPASSSSSRSESINPAESTLATSSQSAGRGGHVVGERQQPPHSTQSPHSTQPSIPAPARRSKGKQSALGGEGSDSGGGGSEGVSVLGGQVSDVEGGCEIAAQTGGDVKGKQRSRSQAKGAQHPPHVTNEGHTVTSQSLPPQHTPPDMSEVDSSESGTGTGLKRRGRKRGGGSAGRGARGFADVGSGGSGVGGDRGGRGRGARGGSSGDSDKVRGRGSKRGRGSGAERTDRGPATSNDAYEEGIGTSSGAMGQKMYRPRPQTRETDENDTGDDPWRQHLSNSSDQQSHQPQSSTFNQHHSSAQQDQFQPPLNSSTQPTFSRLSALQLGIRQQYSSHSAQQSHLTQTCQFAHLTQPTLPTPQDTPVWPQQTHSTDAPHYVKHLHASLSPHHLTQPFTQHHTEHVNHGTWMQHDNYSQTGQSHTPHLHTTLNPHNSHISSNSQDRQWRHRTGTPPRWDTSLRGYGGSADPPDSSHPLHSSYAPQSTYTSITPHSPNSRMPYPPRGRVDMSGLTLGSRHHTHPTHHLTQRASHQQHPSHYNPQLHQPTDTDTGINGPQRQPLESISRPHSGEGESVEVFCLSSEPSSSPPSTNEHQ